MYMRVVMFLALSGALYALDVDELYRPTEADKAVERALEWLSRHQKPDGSWDSPAYRNATGICSLATLAFLANGHLPGKGPYGETVDKAVKFIVGAARPDGLVTTTTSHGPMYCHNITTIMLSEVLGETPDQRVAKVLETAIQVILKAQQVHKDAAHAGGWRYQPGSGDSDLSCTGWPLVALRAAQNAGLKIPKAPVDQAVAYVQRCHTSDGGFCYQPGGGANTQLTGTGTLSLQLAGLYDSDYVKRGAQYLLSHPPTWNSGFFFYGAYYCTNAMYQAKDKYWDFWKPRMETCLLQHQNPDGSWPVPGSEAGAGPVYGTAMAVLALSVEYQYLPIYQR